VTRGESEEVKEVKEVREVKDKEACRLSGLAMGRISRWWVCHPGCIAGGVWKTLKNWG
jgi:hypothetical protein